VDIDETGEDGQAGGVDVVWGGVDVRGDGGDGFVFDLEIGQTQTSI